MELSEAGPYLISGVVALITALLTHKRAYKAHKDTVVIDQQKLVNDTYEQVLSQLRLELQRRQEVFDRERSAWLGREEALKNLVEDLKGKVKGLEGQILELKRAEKKVEQNQHKHHADDSRHVDRRSHPRSDGDDSGTDLPI